MIRPDAAILLCALLFLGCGELEPHPDELLAIGRWPFNEDIGRGIEQDPLLEPADYLVGSGDLLSIEVRDRLGELVADASFDFTVPSTGFQVFPYVGRQQVGGRSLAEVREVYRDGLVEAAVFRDFSVEVFVDRYRQRTVVLKGEGVSGGAVVLPDRERRSLRVLLLTHGGIHDFADVGRIEIFRPSELKTYPVDLWAQIDRGEKFFVEPDDVITIPRAAPIEVRGEVNRPGVFPWAGPDSTFRNAIAVQAGGITRFGSSDVAVRRQVDGREVSWEVDYGDVNEGKLPDFTLRPGDQLWVDNTEFPLLR